MKYLVLGMGNLLLADEGVGVHAVRALQEMECPPPDTEFLEVGTAILDALPALREAEKVIVVDAMKAEGEPGSIYRVPLEQCRKTPFIASLHGFDLSRVIALAGRSDHPEVTVIGVEPGVIGWSMELSPGITAVLPLLLEVVREEMQWEAGGFFVCQEVDG
jgi:hydrogenase maturation protease